MGRGVRPWPPFPPAHTADGAGAGEADNADATATDADYAAQNQLLSMNLVRIFVNAAWWTNNVQVPIANQAYQTYIDGLIKRAEKYVKEYRDQEREKIRLARLAKQDGAFHIPAEEKLVFVIRIKG